MSLVAVFLFVNYLIIHSLQERNTVQTEASDLMQNIRIENVSNQKLAIIFTTKNAYSSEAVVTIGKEQKTYNINESPHFSHFLIISSPPQKGTLVIVLKDKDGQEAITQQVKLP